MWDKDALDMLPKSQALSLALWNAPEATQATTGTSWGSLH